MKGTQNAHHNFRHFENQDSLYAAKKMKYISNVSEFSALKLESYQTKNENNYSYPFSCAV